MRCLTAQRDGKNKQMRPCDYGTVNRLRRYTSASATSAPDPKLSYAWTCGLRSEVTAFKTSDDLEESSQTETRMLIQCDLSA